ncbi:MAG: triose-phosphate isomerase [Candidatus Heimdallarchaeota archaeon]|nr:triose-phosphate isomerase [Candidatus Heimdallarchaeota archaeon]
MSDITYPIIILNYKNYTQTIGKRGLVLSKIAESVAFETGVSIAVCPQTVDIGLIVQEVEIPVLAQHVDGNDAGSYTGNNLLEAVKESGVAGSLVNHSEHRLRLSDIEKIVDKAKKLDFYTCVCSNNIQTSKAIASLEPSACAMEPPELIGSGVSVTTKPELVKQTLLAIKNVNSSVQPLVGAGVTTSQDVAEAVQMGAKGVLLASGFVKAKDPKEVLQEMAQALMV